MKTLKMQFHTESAMHAFAAQLARVLTPGLCLYLKGELGVGKTTFVRGLLRAWGITGRVKSPTYALVEPYEVEGKKIFHFDLYRVEKADELLHIGIHDYFLPTVICMVEWPEKGMPLLPAADLVCDFSFASEGREMVITALTRRGEEALDKFV